MPPEAQELRELLGERRLLQDVLALVRRYDGPLPVPLLDAVLRDTSSMRPITPAEGCRLPS